MTSHTTNRCHDEFHHTTEGNCTDGSSASGEPGCAGECGGGANKTLFSYFTSSLDPDGQALHPWSALKSLCAVQMGGNANCSAGGNPHTDMNLAPVIRSDGSMYVLPPTLISRLFYLNLNLNLCNVDLSLSLSLSLHLFLAHTHARSLYHTMQFWWDVGLSRLD
jgi:hypothetical protein